MNSRIKTPRRVRISGGQRFGTIRTGNRVKGVADLIERAHRTFNAGRPKHEHKATSARKIRKSLRNTDPKNLDAIEANYRIRS